MTGWVVPYQPPPDPQMLFDAGPGEYHLRRAAYEATFVLTRDEFLKAAGSAYDRAEADQ